MTQHLKKMMREGLAIIIVIIILPVLISCTNTSAPQEKEQNHIDPAALAVLMKQKGTAVIDVMSNLECMDHKIPGSQCMPLEELGVRLAESFPNKEQSLVFYCESEECPRGGLAYREAKEEVLKQFHSDYIGRLLAATQGNVSQAARECGLERQALQQLMRRYAIRSEVFREN